MERDSQEAQRLVGSSRNSGPGPGDVNCDVLLKYRETTSFANVSSGSSDSSLLMTTNGTPISSYGKKELSLTIGRSSFRWPFLLAKVTRPKLGADFLGHSGLLVDVRHKRLVKADT